MVVYQSQPLLPSLPRHPVCIGAYMSLCMWNPEDKLECYSSFLFFDTSLTGLELTEIIKLAVQLWNDNCISPQETYYMDLGELKPGPPAYGASTSFTSLSNLVN